MERARQRARVERTKAACVSLGRWVDHIAADIGLDESEQAIWRQELRELVEDRLLVQHAKDLDGSVDSLTHVLAAPLTRQVCSFLDTTSHLRLASCSHELDQRLHHACAWSATVTLCVHSFEVKKSWNRLGGYLRPRVLVMETSQSWTDSGFVAVAACALVRNMRSLESLTTQFAVPSAQWTMLEDKPKLRVVDTYVADWSVAHLKVLASLRNLPALEKISPLRALGSDGEQLSLLADLQLPLVHLTLEPSYGARFTIHDKWSLMPLTRMRDTLRSLLLRDTSSEIIAGTPTTQRLLAAALTTKGALTGLEELGEFQLETLEPELAAAIRARSGSLRHVHFSCSVPRAGIWNRLVPVSTTSMTFQLAGLTSLTLRIQDECTLTQTRGEAPAVWQDLATFIGRSTPSLRCLRIPIRFWRPSKYNPSQVMMSNVELVLRAATRLERFECGCRQEHDTDLRDLVQQVAASLGMTALVVAACDIP